MVTFLRPGIAEFFQDQFKTPELNPTEVAGFETQLAPFVNDRAIQDLLASILAADKSPQWARLVVLRVMTKANPKLVPTVWLQQVGTVNGNAANDIAMNAQFNELGIAPLFTLPRLDLDAQPLMKCALR